MAPWENPNNIDDMVQRSHAAPSGDLVGLLVVAIRVRHVRESRGGSQGSGMVGGRGRAKNSSRCFSPEDDDDEKEEERGFICDRKRAGRWQTNEAGEGGGKGEGW